LQIRRLLHNLWDSLPGSYQSRESNTQTSKSPARTLKIYCLSEKLRDDVADWLEECRSSELESIATWEPDPDGSGTWGVFADGATPDLKDDLEEVFEDSIETAWE
jgi:hypothetical protein